MKYQKLLLMLMVFLSNSSLHAQKITHEYYLTQVISGKDTLVYEKGKHIIHRTSVTENKVYILDTIKDKVMGIKYVYLKQKSNNGDKSDQLAVEKLFAHKPLSGDNWEYLNKNYLGNGIKFLKYLNEQKAFTASGDRFTFSQSNYDFRYWIREVYTKDYSPVPCPVKVNKLKLAQSLRQRIEAGEDFCKLVKEYSDDPSNKNNCGDLDNVKQGQLVTAFENAALALQAGEVSQVVETEFGYHIIFLISKSPEMLHTRHLLINRW